MTIFYLTDCFFFFFLLLLFLLLLCTLLVRAERCPGKKTLRSVVESYAGETKRRKKGGHSCPFCHFVQHRKRSLRIGERKPQRKFDDIFADKFDEHLWTMLRVSLFCCERGFPSLRPFSQHIEMHPVVNVKRSVAID